MSVGIFLGYSLLQLLEYGIAWIDRTKTFCKDKIRIALQTLECLNSENNVRRMGNTSRVHILDQELTGSTTNSNYEK